MKTTLIIEFAADETQLIADVFAFITAARNGCVSVECCNMHSETAEATGPEPETTRTCRIKQATNITHEDIRNLMAEVLEDDEDNHAAVLKQLKKIGAKSVGTIKDEDVADFYDFLQPLKGE